MRVLTLATICFRKLLLLSSIYYLVFYFKSCEIYPCLVVIKRLADHLYLSKGIFLVGFQAPDKEKKRIASLGRKTIKKKSFLRYFLPGGFYLTFHQRGENKITQK